MFLQPPIHTCCFITHLMASVARHMCTCGTVSREEVVLNDCSATESLRPFLFELVMSLTHFTEGTEETLQSAPLPASPSIRPALLFLSVGYLI